eukprot:TRINITY_DN9287_c0_g1_i3.p1 TRINITY_DN9287_c0_g1~~TRINITY_DN9287_c0_g1_i3.p1  ORF type:complete len:519 (-),score=100.98 TRINITY_DN9287_c0_g1_i3:310-1866(-)
MSSNSEAAPQKKRKLDSDHSQGSSNFSKVCHDQSYQEKWNQQLRQIKGANTAGLLDLKVIKEVLLDVHRARRQLEHLKELTASIDNMEKLKETIAEKTESTAEKLDKMHDYLMQSFTITDKWGWSTHRNWKIVLHQAQYGTHSFPLETLPDVPLKKIFNYLEVQERKELRFVSKRMSEILLELRPKMRVFRLNLGSDVQDKTKFLNNLMSKGVIYIKNFKLMFEGVYSERSFSLVKKWKDYIFDLSINTTGKGKNLQKCQQPLPHLYSLSILKNSSEDIMRFITTDLARNVSVLRVTSHVDVGSMAVANLKFANLQQLRIEGPANLPFLVANADQLQKVFIRASSEQSWNAKDLPESLPKIHMLCCDYWGNPDIELEKLLKASAKSLKSLVMSSSYSHQSSHHSLPAETAKLESLTSFVYGSYPGIAPDIIKHNASTLEYISVGMRDCSTDPNIFEPLPKLKEMYLTCSCWNHSARAPYIYQMMQRYPHAKIRDVQVNHDKFANAFVKKHNGSDLFKF